MTNSEHLMTILVVMASYITCTLLIMNQLLKNKIDQIRKDSFCKIEALVKKDRRIAKLEDQILEMQKNAHKKKTELENKIQELEQKNIEDAITFNYTVNNLKRKNNVLEAKIQSIPTGQENLTLLETKVNELKSEINTKNE